VRRIGEDGALGEFDLQVGRGQIDVGQNGRYLFRKLGILEVSGRDINGHVQRFPGAVQAVTLAERGSQHPQGQWVDQACTFRQGNEVIGRNQSVLRMLNEIGSVNNIEGAVARAKDKDDSFRLMGFGHRVYKNFDPRSVVIQKTAKVVLDHLGLDDPLLEIALRLEEIALKDEYFIERKLYPNVDFYSGIVLRAMGVPTNMFTALFALARTVGWVSHWLELTDAPHGIDRPRQLYTGSVKRSYPVK